MDTQKSTCVGNGGWGTLLAYTATAFAKKAFIPLENKPATKKDIKDIKDLINTRYFEVHNISPDYCGRVVYFDMSTSKIVYFNEQQNRFELPVVNL